jgi:ribonuclease P/MRP protein subunit POP7
MAENHAQPSDSADPQLLSQTQPSKSHARKTASKASKIPSDLLVGISFERKNKPQPRLPPNHGIQKRPITHPPVASPYAGLDVQKVVYVSRSTPIMAAVKRVKKLLEQAEKRNLQREGVLGNAKRAGNVDLSARVKGGIKQEKVMVKGSGRAIEQAVKVGEWFKRHADDGDGGWVVKVRPTSVKVVDDIVEISPSMTQMLHVADNHYDDGARRSESQSDEGDEASAQKQNTNGSPQPKADTSSKQKGEQASEMAVPAQKQKIQRPKKRKRPMYDEDGIPEARTRFIDAIEISVSLNRS